MWNILIVEDEPVNQKLLIEMLKNRATCEVAATGKEALRAYGRSIAESKPYDLMLLDLLVPETEHGMEILEEVRRDEAGRGVKLSERLPIIVVTAYKYASKNAFDHGCDDFLHKPLLAKSLIGKIEALLKKKNVPA